MFSTAEDEANRVSAGSSDDDIESEEEEEMGSSSDGDGDNAEFQDAIDSDSEGLEDDDSEGEGSDLPDDDPDLADDEDVEGGSDDGSEGGEEKSGWADAMAKVLGMGKGSADSNKPLLLSKAKKDHETFRKAKAGDAEESSEGGAKSQLSAAAKREKKRELEMLCRSKPDVVKDRARERRLAKLATRGVVQLFNAVREQQKSVKVQLDAAGKSTVKRDKVYKSIDKEGFLDVLAGSKRRIEMPKVAKPAKAVKTEVKQEDDESSWKILRDDFMMGAKMKDWDKDSDND